MVSCERNAEGGFEVVTRTTPQVNNNNNNNNNNNCQEAKAKAAAKTSLLRICTNSSAPASPAAQAATGGDGNAAAAATTATGGIRNLFSSLPAYSMLSADGGVSTTTRREVFDAVCVCTGQLSKPNMPSFPGGGGGNTNANAIRIFLGGGTDDTILRDLKIVKSRKSCVIL